ncbi:MAG: hypothetical protein AB4062_03870 [Crocosphaera sp.]
MKDKFDPFFQQPKFPDLNVLRQELLNDNLFFKQATKPLLEHLNTLARSKTSNILDSSSLGIELRNIESHRAVNINAINRISELAISVE